MAKRTKTPSSPRSPVQLGAARGPIAEAREDKTVVDPQAGHAEVDDEDAVDEPREPLERRLTATLLKIFTRRREHIGLALEQLARLSGISLDQLRSFDHPRAGQTITYDQAVVLTRALGISPDGLPGLRRRETRAHLTVTLGELEAALLAAPLLRFEGKFGERYGGDVERAASSKVFTVRVDDDSLQPAFPRGSLLGFMNDAEPKEHGVLLLRHRRSSMLAMRRADPKAYLGLVEWQPSYVVGGGEWTVCGALVVTLPAR